MAVKYQPLISDTPDLPPSRHAVSPCSMPFDELLQQAVQHTMVDFIRKGDWLKHWAKVTKKQMREFYLSVLESLKPVDRATLPTEESWPMAGIDKERRRGGE